MTRRAANTRPKRDGKGGRAEASIESYSVTAKHYDAAYAVKQDLVDLPFYLNLANRSGGPVLEIACGTGRVLLPIARQGIAIDGVDNSLPMLRVLKSNIEKETPQTRRRITLHNGDMRDFRLRKRYPLVIIPFRPLQHMHTAQDQFKALTTAAFHLRKNGILAFDVFYPKFELIAAGMGQEILDLEWPAGKDSVVRRYFRKNSVDKINQNFSFTFIFRTYQGDKLVREESEPFILSYYTYPHLKALFLLAGLESAVEYGSFAKTPLDNTADQMIFLLRRGGPSRPRS
jgi:SAM-dependent methyltransferase